MGYPDNFVTKILCLYGGEYLVGFYGGGVVKSIKPFRLVDRKLEKTRFNIAPIFSVTQKDFAKLPSPIKPPTAEDLRAMYYKLKKIYRQLNPMLKGELQPILNYVATRFSKIDRVYIVVPEKVIWSYKFWAYLVAI
ncbi:MAG: hypothetical protein LBC74_12785 [Planctomycetaceae bacterium]|jgi:hypothetical protein|nr:hypothetical protein [Planctomycetaceae bacterium]